VALFDSQFHHTDELICRFLGLDLHGSLATGAVCKHGKYTIVRERSLGFLVFADLKLRRALLLTAQDRKK